MNMLTLILPGVAVTYYGEEIGMLDKSDISFEDTQDPAGCQAGKDKYQTKTRDPNRTPMQWDGSTNSGILIFTLLLIFTILIYIVKRSICISN